MYLADNANNNTIGGTVPGAGNVIAFNAFRGVYLLEARDNLFIHNNFIDNGTHVYDEGGIGNVFYLPAPDGGNFWSDWTGPDIDGDGFVDSPYVFVGGQDDLPWSQWDGWLKTPQERLQDLADTIAALNLQQGISNSLQSKLNNALANLLDGNPNNDHAACSQIEAFINQVNAQSGVSIDPSDALNLTGQSQSIIDLVCP